MFNKFVSTIFILCVVGCASHGKKIDANAINQIEKGKTTEAQIISLLGNPMSVSVLPDGKKFLMYMYVKAQAKASSFIPIVGAFAGGSDSKSQTLQIWLDENGIVTAHSYNITNTEINTGLLSN